MLFLSTSAQADCSLQQEAEGPKARPPQNRHTLLIVRMDLLAQVYLEVQTGRVLSSAKPCAFFSLSKCHCPQRTVNQLWL